MCVTNTTNRRPQPVAFNSQQVGLPQSLLSQRLLGAFVPTLQAKQPVYNHSDIQLPPEYVSTVPHEKPRPKRRRKPQKPGKTAKNNERHFVVHDYHDHSRDDYDLDVDDSDDANQRRRGGVSVAFPLKLHSVLDQVEVDGLAHVVSWQKHGRSFLIHKPKEFVEQVMPKYFRQSKLTSFQRQLNLYGFCRLTRGPDAGGYYHELFLRGKLCLCKKMMRTKVKGTKFKAASSPELEPDFYQMPPIVVTPNHSDEESSNQAYVASRPSTMETNVASASSYLEPLPIQFVHLPRSDPQGLFYAQAPIAMASHQMANVQSFNYASLLSIPSDADRILDEAVDELFLQQEEVENLDEFVHDWDPSFDQSNAFGATIEDDSQLGYLLEKLLED